ncbi:hypothetical protein AHAS_Ahas18G0169300 [Arachis hypogaea]
MWDEAAFKLYNCYKGDRWMCIEVVVKDNFHCAICLVYGLHERAEKISMLEELSYIAGLCQVPCCFLGILMKLCTWRKENERLHYQRLWQSHIDRSVVSVGWLDVYPELCLRSGPRGLSDHCPLIMEDSRRIEGPQPFHSLNSWFTHEGFLRMVKKEWRELGDVQFLQKMKALSEPLCRWHKQHFGDMAEQIKKLEEEIRKVDDIVSSGQYDGTTEARRRALVRCCEKWYLR